MYGSTRDINYNLRLFFMDGLLFMPGMTLISITTVIPYFLEQLDASTFQIAMAASMGLVLVFISNPVFGSIASRARRLHKGFAKTIFLQRGIFFAFVLSIPLFYRNPPLLVWLFLFFWGVFNIFVGSYGVFFTPLLLKLLPQEKRGAIRGLGFAIGSAVGVALAALIPFLLNNLPFPYNFMLIFSIGCLFLLVNALMFWLMREPEDNQPRLALNVLEYIKGLPGCIGENASFRAMILMCTFLVIANALIPYYTLYAIRVFSATEAHIAMLAALAVVSAAFSHVLLGIIVDKKGPALISIIVACFVILAGGLATIGNSLEMLFAAWFFANLALNGYMLVGTLLLGEVAPSEKLPLYVGALNTVSMAISSAVVLLLAPALENIGFFLLFIVVLGCGLFSLLINLFVFRKRLGL